MASSLLVALVAAVIGGMAVVFTADPPQRHQRATRDAAVPDARQRRIHTPKPKKPEKPEKTRRAPAAAPAPVVAPDRPRRAPRPPRVPRETDTPHTRVGAFVRLGGLLVLVGTAAAAVIALVLAVGVGLLQHSL